MPTGGLIKRRDAHQPVYSCFGSQQTICVFAFDLKSHAFDSRFLTRLIIDNLGLELPPLGPLQIHTQKHLGPVLRLGSARSWVNRANCVTRIVLTGEERFGLCLQNFVSQSLE